MNQRESIDSTFDFLKHKKICFFHSIDKKHSKSEEGNLIPPFWVKENSAQYKTAFLFFSRKAVATIQFSLQILQNM